MFMNFGTPGHKFNYREKVIPGMNLKLFSALQFFFSVGESYLTMAVASTIKIR